MVIKILSLPGLDTGSYQNQDWIQIWVPSIFLGQGQDPDQHDREPKKSILHLKVKLYVQEILSNFTY